MPDRRDVKALVRGLYLALHERAASEIQQHRRQILALTHSYRFHRPVERLRRNQQHLDDLTARLSAVDR